MASPRLPAPGSFEHLLRPVRVRVTRLVRLSLHPVSEPFWGKAASHRFDDPLHVPDTAGRDRFGVTYCGSNVDIAFCESVIHENSWFDGHCFMVPEAAALNRHVIRYVPGAERTATLKLADFADGALKRLALNTDVTSGDDYSASQAWARAVYEHATDWDGIRYRSRQDGSGYAYAIFERSGLVAAAIALLDGSELDRLLEKYNVALF